MAAVIFDMDGVLVDDFNIHLEAWDMFCRKHQINITEHTLKQHAFGRTNDELMPYFFNREMSKQEIDTLADEKEEIYRRIYKGRVIPVEGLAVFLKMLKEKNIPVGLGTSAPRENAEFVLKETGIQAFFTSIVDGSMVTKGKPEPDIYLMSARMLNTQPSDCIVFEDSFAGIESARRAKMKVVGVATTHPAEKLTGCNDVIRNFTEMSINKLEQLK